MIADNLQSVRRNITAVANRCGRNPEKIRLVAVSKTFPVKDMKEARAAGQILFGENYIQEAGEKFNELDDQVQLHFIGHLQSNKAHIAARIFRMVETVDRIKLALSLNRYLIQSGRTMDILIQVNIGKDEKKSGIAPEDIENLLKNISSLSNLRPLGLMTIPPFSDDPEKSRKLIIGTNRADVRLVIVRASDVPTYVQYGAADIGVAGKDVLLEHASGGLYQPLDLIIGKCKMMVAVREGFDYAAAVKRGARLNVATKYVQVAREHFATKGMHVNLIKLYGSMELAPLTGLADAIVDLVSTGNTLKANHLVAVENIVPISSRLIVNRAALKLKRTTIQPMIDAFANASASTPSSAMAS